MKVSFFIFWRKIFRREISKKASSDDKFRGRLALSLFTGNTWVAHKQDINFGTKLLFLRNRLIRVGLELTTIRVQKII